MIKDYKRGDLVTSTYYEVVFDDGCNNGFGFSCDEKGKITNDNPTAIKNYNNCLANPDKFVRYNKIIKHERTYRKEATGICKCGNRIPLYNEYLGACECPHCGQWWSMSGQELNPVETWANGEDW